MKDFRQVVLGVLAALISMIILIGSLSLALMESGMRLVQAPTVLPSFTATLPPPIFTPTPGNSPTPGPSPVFSLTPSPTFSPTFTPLVTSSCLYPPGWSPIIVLPGDTLDNLAAMYGTTPDVLMAGNCLVTRLLIPGTMLYVPGAPTPEPTEIPCGPPPGWVFYTVQSGDTLYHLAQVFGVTVRELQFANCLTGTLIRVGQRLYVPFYLPTRSPTPSATLTPTGTPIFTPTLTPTLPPPPPTDTPTATITPPSPPTPTVTVTPPPTDTPTPTDTETPTATPTETPTPSPTPSPSPGG